MKLLKQIQFNTGRGYTKEGQIVDAFLVSTDKHGIVVYFNDKSRGVDGMFKFPSMYREDDLSERTVMHYYDRNYITTMKNGAGIPLYMHEIEQYLDNLNEEKS